MTHVTADSGPSDASPARDRLIELSRDPGRLAGDLPVRCVFTDRFGKNWEIRHDPDLDLGVTFPRIEPGDLGPYYGEDYHCFAAGRGPGSLNHKVRAAIYRRPTLGFFKNFFDVIIDRLPPDGRILDFGCGNADRMRFYRALGIQEVYGLEPNVEPNDEWEREGIVVKRDLDEYAGFEFDAIILSHVLEHLFDFQATLERLRTVCRPNAKIYIAVPNLHSTIFQTIGPNWLMLDAPRHLWHFSYKSLRTTLEASGYEVVKFYTKPVYPANIGGQSWLRKKMLILKALAIWSLNRQRSDGITMVARAS